MTDLLERKAVKQENKQNVSQRGLFGQSFSNIDQGSQKHQGQQPDSAFLTQQTVADIPQHMPPAKMSIRDLNFYYGDFQALKNINIDIPDKKVTAFIGPSGCGKSTLLRTFNRMYDLYPGMRAEGNINLDGKNILGKDIDVNLLRAQVGMVFQKPTPFPMSIYDNVAFGVRLYEKLSKAEMDNRVEWALKKAALWLEVKTNFVHQDCRYPVVNNNVFVSLAVWRQNLKYCS